MVITADVIRKIAENNQGEDNQLKNYSGNDFIQRLIKQTKRISQLMAESWDPEAESTRKKKIQDAFLNFYLGKDKDALKTLFLEEKVFTSEELKVYSFEVDINIFEGSLTEANVREKPFFKIVLPYPPKPSDDDLKWADIEQWKKSPTHLDDPTRTVDNPFPPAAYFPLSTC